MVNWDQVRDKFSILRNVTYLNTASMGLIPKEALAAGKKWMEERLQGSPKWIDWYKESQKVKEKIGKIIGAEASEIALVPNTSYGLNLAALSIEWREGDNIITNDMEFPANRNIWQVISKRYGVKLKVAKSKNGEVKIEQYKELIDNKTKAIAVSWVQFSNGFVHDLEALSELVDGKNIYLIIDGIQGVGALQLNLKKLNISFLACGGHKWIMGLPGSGFLYVKNEIHVELNPQIAGWLSSEEPFKFDQDKYIPAKNSRKFELGSPSFIGYRVLDASLDLLNMIGLKRVEKRNKELAYELIQRIKGKYEINTPLRDGYPLSSIISIKHRNAGEIVKNLEKNNIIVSHRLGSIRVSFHFYNNEEDIERFLNMIREKS